MVIYPIPTVVSQAKVQLAADQEAKASAATINSDVDDIAEVQADAERQALVDLRV